MNYNMVHGSIIGLRKTAEEYPDMPFRVHADSLKRDDERLQEIEWTVLIALGAELYLLLLWWLPKLLSLDSNAQTPEALLLEAAKLLKDVKEQDKPIQPTPDQGKMNPSDKS